MNEYDLVSRRFAKLAEDHYLSWLLKDFPLHLRFLRWLDARQVPFPNNPDRTGDVVAELEQLDESAPLWALANEFQTVPDPLMFGRLLVYLGNIWLGKRPDPLRGSRYNLVAAVVNLTGTAASTPASRSATLPGPDGAGLALAVVERWLQAESALELLESIRAGRYSRWLLVLVPLMAADDPKEVIRQWLELFGAEPQADLRSEWCGLAGVLCELSQHTELWRTALEGLNVTRSPFLESIRAEGRKEGIKEGRAEASAQSLMKLLDAKFPGQTPAEVVRRVQQCRDLDRLDEWFSAALVAGSLEAFLRESALSPNGH